MYRDSVVINATNYSIMKINIDAAKRLRQLRHEAGYESAHEFAEKNNFSAGTYRSHENGSRNITLSAARKYAKALKSSSYWIIEGSDDQSAPRFDDIRDSEVALVDALKDVFQILIHSNLITPESIKNTLTYQTEFYREKNLPNAVLVMDELKDYVTAEKPTVEKEVIRRLLQLVPLGNRKN